MLAKALEKEEWGWAVAVGVCAGVAAAVRLNGLLLALLPAGAFVLQSRSRSIRGVCIMSGSAVLVLCLLQPYLLTQPGLLWQSESSNDLAYSLGIARGDVIKP